MPDEIVGVEQADREAAAAIIRWQRNVTDQLIAENDDKAFQFFVDGFTRGIMQGIWDEHDIVQSYARHRLAAQPSSLQAERDVLTKEVAELVEMIDAAETRGGTMIWEHTPEEIGLHVMENWQAIRAALQASADGGKG